jgi:glycosyltransferase involved in cell wall biosynthesis
MNACMIAYTFYEEDNRVRRYAEALAKRGDRVDVIALQRCGLPAQEVIKGVSVYRIQERVRNEKGKCSYLSRLLKFLVKSAVFISKRHLASPYDLVHVHSVPDFEVFAALVPKMTGAKIILDIHDIVPEFYAAKFDVPQTSFVYKALVFMEKISIRFSDHVIISNHLWEQKLVGRSVRREKCSTYLNYPDPAIFHRPVGSFKPGKKFLMMYPGSLNWHQGLDIAVKAFALASRELENAEFHIYGEGPEEHALRTLVADLRLEDRVLFKGSLPLEAISEAMATASVGVVPKRNDSFGGEAFSTKIFEFMSLGVPIILSRTRIDNHYFNDSIVRFFEPENYRDLAESLIYLAKNEEARQQLASNALEFVRDYCWDRKSCDYFGLVRNMTAQNSPSETRS